MTHPYDDFPKTPANFVALSPLSFLPRAARVYADQAAIVYGDRRITWAATYQRCRQFASQLAARGVGHNDTVSCLLPNVPAMLELHFAVPMTGAVLNTINTRLDSQTVAFILEHADSKVLLVDPEFAELALDALKLIEREIWVINVADPAVAISGPIDADSDEYEALVEHGDPEFVWQLPEDEWHAISLNYTSGTTGNPKGVVSHHRGAYLNAVGNIVAWSMPARAVFLWTLPLFHCNGWCFPWSIAANGGTSICLRKVDPVLIFKLIKAHQVGYFCGAPTVHTMLINTRPEDRVYIDHPVEAMIAGAAPPAAIIAGMRELGFGITHTYGLTETYGPSALCAAQPGWDDLSIAEQADKHGRQGFNSPLQEAMTVLDPQTLHPVPVDGETMGEIMFRGNLVMKGYLKNPAATAEAFSGGWFHSGDLAVCQPDGYAKIKDRAKDVIISGGENISSLEVEEALYRHPAVLAAAVVAMDDEKWGEVPCAFIELKQGSSLSVDAIREHCYAHLARFKVPKRYEFGEIPKTSTGKLQKFILRDRLKQKV
ncbi:acyl-CoA synthetase [Aquirhabdus parva]|uniref:Acyl-CoA synthetase n=1 Tax=Aquirhabdus parva TaxID=2283318 RepID=A0A345P823_9GAMM|nr:acyl-CoA synthetase [Aquirhabdus parva]AXI03432.1 acyl-CoA synthetase [Aquirhabdus parva]